jgi:hypothetical protein
MNRARCQNPAMFYKPQWAYQTPAGYRDETFLVPFQFTIPGTGQIQRGLPLQLDDDQPFILHGIIFPQIGTENDPPLMPALCRITDTHGNPLSEGLVLALGMWAEPGIDSPPTTGNGTAAFGFPIEPEIECAPGGTLLFDFQATTNAGVAHFLIFGALEGVQLNANVFGTVGNAFTIALLDPGAANVPLSVAVVGGVNVQVTLQTDGAAALISTFPQIANIINNTPAAFAIMQALAVGTNAAEVAAAVAATPLAGGAASRPYDLEGCLLGVKRFKGC